MTMNGRPHQAPGATAFRSLQNFRTFHEVAPGRQDRHIAGPVQETLRDIPQDRLHATQIGRIIFSDVHDFHGRIVGHRRFRVKARLETSPC